MPVKAIVFDAYGTLYDVQSVARMTEETYPGHGATITQIWRLKQLEYTWLRGMMDRYVPFSEVTRESLRYTLATLGLGVDDAAITRLSAAYEELALYPDSLPALEALAGHRLAILSNGSPGMLDALVRATGLDRRLEAVISVDEAGMYKPHRRAYETVERRLGVAPGEVVFVSSNGFDVAGGKAFGFRVARMERVSPRALSDEMTRPGVIPPATLFKALRSQEETFGPPPDWTISALTELPALVAAA